jgi:transcriptional regulator with PAS, ATPase and Fis domain
LAAPRLSVEDIVGESASMTELKIRTRMAAASSSTVLLEGESGTGKELVAQAIHYSGQRSAGPFVAVNCAALPESLVESELFGYEEGSFTGAKKGGQAGKFEMANRGTLFLDEIGDMPLCAQMKMLRVIQERKVTRIGATVDREIDIRIIAATLKDLKQEVKEGRFRQDLYYRLNVLNLRIPPLRERLEDIPDLAQSLAIRIAARMKVDAKEFDEGLLDKLKFYSWPGNVRELENTIERAINLAGDDSILRAGYFELVAPDAGMDVSEPAEGVPLRPLNEVEEEMIRKAIAFHNGNINKAAISLGISRNTLYRKMKEYEANSAVPSRCA